MNGTLDMAKLISRNNKNQSKLQTKCNGSGCEETNCKLLGMVSNNMSNVFHKICYFFMKTFNFLQYYFIFGIKYLIS